MCTCTYEAHVTELRTPCFDVGNDSRERQIFECGYIVITSEVRSRHYNIVSSETQHNGRTASEWRFMQFCFILAACGGTRVAWSVRFISVHVTDIMKPTAHRVIENRIMYKLNGHEGVVHV